MNIYADLINKKFSINFSKNECEEMFVNQEYIISSYLGLMEILKSNALKLFDASMKEYENFFLSHVVSNICIENGEMYVRYTLRE